MILESCRVLQLPLRNVLRHNNKFYSVLCLNCHENRTKQQQSTTRNFSLQSLGNTYMSMFDSISKSKGSVLMKDSLIYIHDTTGLPWWASILLATTSLRLFCTFPLSIYQAFLTAKLELIKIEFRDIVQELKRETMMAVKKFDWTEKEAKYAYTISLKKQWRLLVERENCHPFKTTLVLWFQIPLWILFSMALRNMAYRTAGDSVEAQITALQFSVGGTLWAPNLLVPDSTLILPVTVALVNLMIVELQVLSKVHPPTKLQTILTNLFRGFALVTLPISMSVPSCMSYYWACSSVLALAQNLTLMSPSVRRKLGVPKTPSELEHPYKHIMTSFKNKWRIR